MRLFYEHWAFLDAKSSITTDNFNSSVATDDISASTLADNSATSIVKLEDIDIYNTIQVPLTQDFPIEDFFRVPFTHHVEIYKIAIELKTGEFKTSYLGQLMGYLTILDEKVRKSHENPSIGMVLCKSANREYVEFMIRDYSKPMGVATYKTADDMPEKFRKALPDIDALKKLMSERQDNKEDEA